MDDHGSYPAGRYLRSPPGSNHARSIPNGAVIFVKLGQMSTD
ncbi:cupin domain-containing protein [Pseudomonas sp. 39167]